MVGAVAMGMACSGGGLGPVGPGASAGTGNAGGAGGGGCLEGSESCPCYPNQTCDNGLGCVSHVCVNLGGGAPSAGGGAGGIAAVGGALSAGGTAPTGGNAPAGGTATGGTATGGTATGGVATGGRATGGVATGGASTGGSSGGEPCSPATEQTTNACVPFGTAEAVCVRTAATILGWGCTNFGGRTVQVNNVFATCGDPLPPRWTDGYYYFAVSAGEYSYACIYWW
jgi:hypothetical protein